MTEKYTEIKLKNPIPMMGDRLTFETAASIDFTNGMILVRSGSKDFLFSFGAIEWIIIRNDECEEND